MARRGVWIVGGATALFHVATSNMYSYHRDELYYLACGRRLARGYADHPPLTPLLHRLSEELFRHSLLGLRIVPALVHDALVVVTAALARERGPTRRPRLELSRHISDPLMAAFTLPYQVVLLGAASMLAVPGFLRVVRGDAHVDRPFGTAFVVIVALVMLTGGKPYYAAVFGPVLVAAG